MTQLLSRYDTCSCLLISLLLLQVADHKYWSYNSALTRKDFFAVLEKCPQGAPPATGLLAVDNSTNLETKPCMLWGGPPELAPISARQTLCIRNLPESIAHLRPANTSLRCCSTVPCLSRFPVRCSYFRLDFLKSFQTAAPKN